MFDLVLKNARLVTPAGLIPNGSVATRDGKIVALGGAEGLGASRREIDLEGKVLFPGMFDPHCHLGSGDERTYEYMSESFAQDTRDFLLGGVTSFATTTVLTRDSLPDNIRKTKEAGAGRSWADFRVTSVVLSEEHVEQIPAAIREGVLSFKFYCGYCLDQAERMGMSPGGVPPDMFYRACEQVVKTDPRALLMIHAEEPHVRRMLAERMKAAGRTDLIAWAEHSPQWSEAVQVALYGEIAHELKARLYVVHISRAPTVDMIEYLRSRGASIIGETLACFLSTTAQERHECGCGLKAKIQPPIRFREDQDRLWRSIREGSVTAIGTDTIPYTSKYKSAQPFWNARPGLNIQTIDTLPLLLTEGYHSGKADLVSLARALSENPARYFGVGDRKGKIEPGYDADLVVIDPDREAELGLGRMRGRSDYSIWEGKKVRGLPVMTFLRGKLVAENGEIVADEPTGAYQAPGDRAPEASRA
ncbi:MAG TPA: amidohydrolase family protein [Bdellovibrionota bacterium]|nr:amidohydrolase family protein [Bdellovibrionota bacterium]